MPLFKNTTQELKLIKPQNFAKEKELQQLIENNLHTIFSCQFVATEFSTGSLHGGRIDTLAISEDNNPVIIEYKNKADSSLITQSLFYLAWLKDHKGDFEVAVNKLYSKLKVDWSNIRVICISPKYKKYDLHAAQVISENIELWQYKYYEDYSLFFDLIYSANSTVTQQSNNKNPVMVEAGKKAAITRATGVYCIEDHTGKLAADKRCLFNEVRDHILNLSDAVEEIPKKHYIGYKLIKNFVCMRMQKHNIVLYLKVDTPSLVTTEDICRDVTNIGHRGTGNLEVTINNEADCLASFKYIDMSFKNIGGS